MIITLREVFDIIAMTLLVGVIFSSFFRFLKKQKYNPLEVKAGIDWESMKMAIIITAPGILFHELGHKFAALGFGIEATFHASYFWLMIGVILSLMNTGIIFFIPAYVSIASSATPLQNTIISFAGPFVNLLLYVMSFLLLRYNLVKRKNVPLVLLTKRINGFLFLFNMIPIPPFDGSHVLLGLYHIFF